MKRYLTPISATRLLGGGVFDEAISDRTVGIIAPADGSTPTSDLCIIRMEE